jgi:hypothetical protein
MEWATVPGVNEVHSANQMTFDPELKIWDAQSEADFDGWQLRMVEKLPVDPNEQSCLVTIRRDRERRQVYVAKELGEIMRARFVKTLEAEWIDTVQREAWRDHLGR